MAEETEEEIQKVTGSVFIDYSIECPHCKESMDQVNDRD
jgi:hypothetical protein